MQATFHRPLYTEYWCTEAVPHFDICLNLEIFFIVPMEKKKSKKLQQQGNSPGYQLPLEKIIRTARQELVHDFHDTITIFLLSYFVIKIRSHTPLKRHKPARACPKRIHKGDNSNLGEKCVFIGKYQHLLCSEKQGQMPCELPHVPGIINAWLRSVCFLEKLACETSYSVKLRNACSNWVIHILRPKPQEMF